MTLYEPEEEPIGLPVKNWKPVDPKPAAKGPKVKRVEEKKKRTIKRKMQIIVALMAIASCASLYGVHRVGQFYEKYTTSLQSPVLLQWPVKVEERKAVEAKPVDPQPVENIPEKAAASAVVKTAQAKEPAKVIPPAGEIQEAMHAKVVAKWGEKEWPAMLYVMGKESSMKDPFVVNKSSGACGIPQALPCSKLLAVCKTLADWNCQLDWMVTYVASRYKTPSGAMAFHKENNWY